MAILEVNENQKQMLYQILKIQDRKLKSKDKIKNLGGYNISEWVTDVEDVRNLLNQLEAQA
jgi:hypothetical protein